MIENVIYWVLLVFKVRRFCRSHSDTASNPCWAMEKVDSQVSAVKSNAVSSAYEMILQDGSFREHKSLI